MEFQHARDAEAYLLSLINYEAQGNYKRDTTTHDLQRFGERLKELKWNPKAYPTIHIGGTNGKGSVAMLTEAVLRGAGKRTGLFTSPHLRHMRERIRIDGEFIPEPLFCALIGRLARIYEPGTRGIRTTFEHLTAAALLGFQESGVDWGVLEVGLGGKLDATNVIPPGIAVITPISLDHQNVLGNTLEKIAADKAHILKSGGEAWILPQPPGVMAVLEERLREQGVPARVVNAVDLSAVERTPGGTTYRVEGRENYGEVATGLMGRHQDLNLQCALALADSILTPEEMRRAVASLQGITLPGRMECVSFGGKQFVVDGGHNPGAAHAIRDALELHFPGDAVLGVVGMAKEKDARVFLSTLGQRLSGLLCTASGNLRAMTGEDLLERSPGHLNPVGITTVPEAMEEALARPQQVVLVTGSFIVAGEALEWLELKGAHAPR